MILTNLDLCDTVNVRLGRKAKGPVRANISRVAWLPESQNCVEEKPVFSFGN
jgi:hypothetical protein